MMLHWILGHAEPLAVDGIGLTLCFMAYREMREFWR